MDIQIKRVYEETDKSDGLRILVDRLWPRGVKKEKVDLWIKDIAPSSQLRKWFSHDPKKWDEFVKRYQKEIDKNALKEITSKKGKITLLYSAKDEEHNNAVALLKIIKKAD